MLVTNAQDSSIIGVQLLSGAVECEVPAAASSSLTATNLAGPNMHILGQLKQENTSNKFIS
jgi:hypothetical protein